MPWDVAMGDPVAAIGLDLAEQGDTFGIDSGGQEYLFTFSPEGVRSFYELDESDASKGVADWRMLRRKVPDQLFFARRTLPTQLFGRRATAEHLSHVERCMDAQLAELEPGDEVDLFDLTRRIGHRIGLASWGPGGLTGEELDGLVAVLDVLDGSDAFVRPSGVLRGPGEAEEAALAEAHDLLTVVIRRAESDGLDRCSEMFTGIWSQWKGDDDEVRHHGVAGDVILSHMGSMSNLFAALGWAVVDLLDHPELLSAVVAGDRALLEACCLESIRLAQRSVMLREVLTELDFDTGDVTYRCQPGVTLATLLPLTNTSAGPGLDTFDPTRWSGPRLSEARSLPAPELVATFGHGGHACPARPFSLAVMTSVIRRLLAEFDLEMVPLGRPGHLPGQIGGVARPDRPCSVALTAAAR